MTNSNSPNFFDQFADSDPATRVTPALPPDAPNQATGDQEPGNEGLRWVGEELSLAYHGARAFVTERRRSFSGSRMEKMEHKDALYSGLGGIAINGKRSSDDTASGELARPRTVVERMMDQRIDKRRLKQSRAETYAYRAEKIFGPKGSAPERTQRQRKIATRAILHDQLDGRKTAREARVAATEIAAEKLNYGEGMHKRTSHQLDVRNRQLNRSASHPTIARWRDSRRRESIADIKRHHLRAEGHRAEQDRVLADRYAREARRNR